MGISAWDIEHLGEILAGRGDWFTAQLLRLILKADTSNRVKLSVVFPEEVRVVELWQSRRSDDEWQKLVETFEIV